ncbi:MAG: [FeFe] hydrogenase H-cluster radical SAM maturase HydE [Bacteroidetes bacterium]|nr:MAG: [FeFe] hydrogenase H-cluster radical SAM maturase HydE [Bacteroidota bacterium]
MPRFQVHMDALLGGSLSPSDIAPLLRVRGEELMYLSAAAQVVRMANVGPGVYLRGLVELGNACEKDCLYCGIRRGNGGVVRYELEAAPVVEVAAWAHRQGFASLAIQAGERTDGAFTRGIVELLERIGAATGGELGITLSLGEQAPEVYRAWRAAGAMRYLLRIETSSPGLYRALHPDDGRHAFDARLACLRSLRQEGYQVGTGVMIGLPGQGVEDLAEDLLALRAMEVDMVGMGPYLLHPDTPLAARAGELWTVEERFDASVAMVAVLRILMPTINIAATTALQAIRPDGRDWALRAGANVLMPNITPRGRQDDYSLYAGKPQSVMDAEDSLEVLAHHVEERCGCELRLGEQGNSRHYLERQK